MVGGCGSSASSTMSVNERLVTADLTDALREEALKLPENGQRERLVTGLIQLRELLSGGTSVEAMLKYEPPPSAIASARDPKLPEPPGGAAPAPQWATIFTPKSLVIGYFTETRNFGGNEGESGIEVRLRPLDQFGDPTKAIGSYRIEVFEYRQYSGEKRGVRLGHWFISVLDIESNRKYYDAVDRSYVFPLLWDKTVEAGKMVVVQATFYPPAGFQEKLFAQRVIRVGGE